VGGSNEITRVLIRGRQGLSRTGDVATEGEVGIMSLLALRKKRGHKPPEGRRRKE
jgi:hypothetical protein